MQRQLPITSFGPVNVSVRCCRCPRIDQLHLQRQLPMSSLGPINFPAGAADTLRLAHCIYSCRCRWPHMGPLPSGRCCRCPHMGPLLFWEVLTMPLHGPINIPKDVADALVWACECFCEVLPMPSHRPITLTAAAAHVLAWAHLLSGRCCRHPQIGPLHLQL